jgi:hypothetical protein
MAKAMPQEELKQLVLEQFGIRITCPLSIETLQHTEWMAASKWPHFTLLGQTLAAAFVGYYAARQFVPEVHTSLQFCFRPHWRHPELLDTVCG